MDFRQPQPLQLVSFESDPLLAIGETRAQYLRCYLTDLGATTALIEPYYFDRDYLAEFAAFYCTSAVGYPNTCRRVHYFSIAVSRAMLESAMGGDPSAAAALQASYLGFFVERPISHSPIGKTVLRWYPDDQKNPRIISPSRTYRANVAGLSFAVDAIAWQEQDSAVGACATISLWTMLQSSGLDGERTIPTTADVTRAANATIGTRVFPSDGLQLHQIIDAIKGLGLAPVIFQGDLREEESPSFSRERFCATVTNLIRSGFPAMIIGEQKSVGLHAVCGVGFRSAPPMQVPAGTTGLYDTAVPHIYIHNDNIGPAVRCAVGETNGVATLTICPPEPRNGTRPIDPTTNWSDFVPHYVVAAVPHDLRVSPDALVDQGTSIAIHLAILLKDVTPEGSAAPVGLTITTKFTRVATYLSHDLSLLLGDKPEVLASARLGLLEGVRPMSLYVGVFRIGIGNIPVCDILYDTSDHNRSLKAFAHIVTDRYVAGILKNLSGTGIQIQAFM